MEEEKRVTSDATEDPKKTLPNGEAAAAELPEAAQQSSALEAAQKEIAKLANELLAARAENEEMKDKGLRLVAEMENFRRRTERDKADFSKYAISEFARDVLSVADNIRRAIESVPKDAQSSPAVHSLIEGVSVTERELLKVLERYQVTRFDPLGEPFNPHLHDAMTKVDIPNVPAETVVQVIHAGYMIGERVLRPAAVIVAKGGGAVEQMPKPSSDITPEAIPLGAMKIPDNAVSSSSATIEPASAGRLDMQQTVFGRHLGGEKRRPVGNEPLNEDRGVAPFRRGPRPGGGNPALDNGRQQQHSQNKPTSLHKPIISKHD